MIVFDVLGPRRGSPPDWAAGLPLVRAVLVGWPAGADRVSSGHGGSGPVRLDEPIRRARSTDRRRHGRGMRLVDGVARPDQWSDSVDTIETRRTRYSRIHTNRDSGTGSTSTGRLLLPTGGRRRSATSTGRLVKPLPAEIRTGSARRLRRWISPACAFRPQRIRRRLIRPHAPPPPGIVEASPAVDAGGNHANPDRTRNIRPVGIIR